MWKKQDEAHDMADSKDDALIWLSENGHIGGDTSPETEPTPEPDTSPTPSPDTGEPATTDGGGVTFPENPDAGDVEEEVAPAVESDPEPECPADGCDGEIVDTTAMLRRRPELSAEHKQLLLESDHVCVECGGVFDQ